MRDKIIYCICTLTNVLIRTRVLSSAVQIQFFLLNIDTRGNKLPRRQLYVLFFLLVRLSDHFRRVKSVYSVNLISTYSELMIMIIDRVDVYV
jgi:hypothetical protein